MTEAEILHEIDLATAARAEAWELGESTSALSDKLDSLYADLRLERARQRNGNRDEIKRRARVEQSLEKLVEI